MTVKLLNYHNTLNPKLNAESQEHQPNHKGKEGKKIKEI